jgi:hypothetical protein
LKTLHLRSQYNYFKDNLSIIILIPTIIGGIWQLVELSSISTSFIRFFSLSQLVADGILILFILSIFYASFKVSGTIIKKNEFQFNITKTPTPTWNSIVTIILGLFAFFFISFPLLEKIYKRQTITIFEIVLLIPIMTMTIGLTFLGFFRLLENFIYSYPNMIIKYLNKIKDDTKFKENIAIIAASSTVLISAFLLKFILVDMNPYISNFRQYIVFPENLINKELLDKRIIKEYDLKFKPVLIYNNDKYFFYKVYDNDNKRAKKF